jgi:hypothetical protein
MDRRLAKIIAEKLDDLHSEREKPVLDSVIDGAGLVS